ncbi:unnamed protein product [Phytophthora fragariaefolia]|uniref:Unnamed protein product n=1 Tax=Phytophthora fragariaefolia TaxID=1490495 RepID=A0A9W7D3R6_9STRA|nr:unnamed protein product [Phytophthora fragariaefolia]
MGPTGAAVRPAHGGVGQPVAGSAGPRERERIHAGARRETAAGITPLLAVVMAEDTVALGILVEFKVLLTHETKHHVNAVLLAADKGREQVLRALLDYGADVDGVNGMGRSTLIQATMSGNTDLIRLLLAYGASKELRDRDGKSALDWAMQLRNAAIVSALSSPLTRADLYAQLKAEDEDEDGEDLSSLSTNRVRQQKRKAEMDKALRNTDLGMIRELLSTEGFQLSPNYEDAHGNTPLLVACRSGTYADVVFCLKCNCIPIHQNREGISALMAACKRGDEEMIRLLMKCGSSLMTCDFSGNNGFYYLNSFDHPDLAIDYTIKQRGAYTGDKAPTFVLGSVVPLTGCMKSEYLISLAQADISFSLEGASDDSSRTVDDTASVRSSYDEHENVELDDQAIRKWGIRQETLKRDKHRKILYEQERERILAVRTRGRRNGIIAPLPSDPAGRLKFPICDNCQLSRAHKRCLSCDQVLCDKCHARLHELAYRRHHQYEELKPKLHIGHELREIALSNQENSLQYAVVKSDSCVVEMRKILVGDDNVPQSIVPLTSIDPEVEKYHRKQRIAKEKAISQMQINVPVVAAKHATQVGEGMVYTQPAELELAALYTTQKKFDKARVLLRQVERLVTDSLGILHPTMLKVAIGKARIDQRYHEAVRTCHHVYNIRVRALTTSHKCVSEIIEKLDEFISKREMAEMGKQDLVTLEKIEQERRQLEQLANESEKHLANFRHLMMKDPEGLATFSAFARQEFAEDLVTFWISIEEFKEVGCTSLSSLSKQLCNHVVKYTQEGIDSKTLRSRAVTTYLTYIKSRRIKVITAAQRKKIKKAITTPGKKLQQTIYDDVQAQIFELIYKGVYVRYLAKTK